MNRRRPSLDLLVLFLFIFLLSLTGLAQRDADLAGDYCRDRRPRSCCPSRDDSCSVPILGTLCYCDMFCNQTSTADCCPDFWEHCMGIAPPTPTPNGIFRHRCIHGGVHYYAGESIQLNCNKCTCRQASSNNYEFACEERACLVRPEIIEAVNRDRHGWTAANYSFFWGKTLEDGVRYRLGTYKPSKPTMAMNEMHVEPKNPLPDTFDARVKWYGLIQPIRDQGNCGSSWAFSTTALASDRLAIQTNGEEKEQLSPQHLISCQIGKQKGCEGGHIDRAWWYLRKRGVTTEQCFPYDSGRTNREGPCLVSHNRREVTCPAGETDYLRYVTPPYRVGPKEELIKYEIFTNGPVQATFRVHEDFFMYRKGVYSKTRHSEHLPAQYRQHGWHSVRILGWGIDRSGIKPVKYWLCDNSWGRQWGEDGYFRIRRGENECDIEMFIVGIWGKRNLQRHRHRHENRISNEIGRK